MSSFSDWTNEALAISLLLPIHKDPFDRYGDAYAAADRLRIMFELTSDLVQEASTGVPVASEVDDSNDDVHKWIQAWTYNGSQCAVKLTPNEWEPCLNNYAHFLQSAGQPARAHEVLQ